MPVPSIFEVMTRSENHGLFLNLLSLLGTKFLTNLADKGNHKITELRSDKIPNSNFHNSIISHMNQMLEKLMGKQADDTFNEPFQPNEILKAVKHLQSEWLVPYKVIFILYIFIIFF
jgi:hypothetical protein